METFLHIWIILSFVEVGRHLYYIWKRRKSPRKWLSLSLRIVIALCLIYLEMEYGWRPWWIVWPTYIMTSIFIHDTGMAIGTAIIFKEYREMRPWYVNKHGVFDKPQNDYAPYIWFGKLLLGVGLPIAYYINTLKDYSYGLY